MQRHDEVVAARRARAPPGASGASIRSRIATSVSIIVLPTSWIASAGRPSRQQVVARLRRVDEQQLRELVGDDPVDLLRHRAVEGAQPGLDVADRESAASRHRERRGQRRVHVARNEHDVRLASRGAPARAAPSPRGLLRVRPGADSERVVRLADAELLEEDLGQLAVVVLAGVDERRARTRRRAARARRRSARSSSSSAACRRPTGLLRLGHPGSASRRPGARPPRARS